MDIHKFASKWLLEFKTEQDLYKIFDTLEFSNDARAAGFVMDAGHSILVAFPEIRTLNDLDMIKTKRDDPRADIQLIGAAIYSQWRYVNHWSDEPPSERIANGSSTCLAGWKSVLVVVQGNDRRNITVSVYGQVVFNEEK